MRGGKERLGRDTAKRWIRRAVVAGVATLACGCTIGPNYERPAVETPAAYRFGSSGDAACAANGVPMPIVMAMAAIRLRTVLVERM